MRPLGLISIQSTHCPLWVAHCDLLRNVIAICGAKIWYLRSLCRDPPLTKISGTSSWYALPVKCVMCRILQYIKLFPENKQLICYMFQRKYLRFAAEGSSDKIPFLWELMTRLWNLNPPTIVISVTGGSVKSMDSSVRKSLSEAINRIVSRTGLC